MLSALLIALLVALAAGAAAVLFEIVRSRLDRRPNSRRELMGMLAAAARETAGQVTVDEAAQALTMTRGRADRLLRELVDDVELTIGVDERRGVVVFAFPALRKLAIQAEGAVYVFTRSTAPPTQRSR